MYFTEQSMMFSYMQDLGFFFQQDQLNNTQAANSMAQDSLLDYDMGAEGDLFRAPETILEEPDFELEPIITPISLLTAEEDLFDNNQLLNDVFRECNDDKPMTEGHIHDLPETETRVLAEEQKDVKGDKLVVEVPMQKSVSTGCLNSKDRCKSSNGTFSRPNFLDFEEMGFEAALGMRRAHSEGDIQNFANKTIINSTAAVFSSFNPTQNIDDSKRAARRKQILRYKKKKERRNFGRNIKYACRKALAENQLRIRGRFARI